MLSALCASAAGWAKDFHWEVPNVVEQVDMHGQVNASGIPVHLHAAVSKLKVSELEEYFSHAFKSAGLYIAPRDEQQQPTRFPQLTGLDPDKRISYTVILQPNADGSTTVVMGEANLSSPPRAAGEDFAPLYPGATQVSRLSTEGRRTVLFTTQDPPEKVRAFYRTTLAQAGYRVDPAAQDTFLGTDGWIRLATRKDKKGLWVILEQGQGEPPRLP